MIFPSRLIGFFLLGLSLMPETAVADEVLFFATPQAVGKSDKKFHVKLDGSKALSQIKLDPRRGTVVVRLTVKNAFGGYGQHVTIYPGPPTILLRCSAQWLNAKPGERVPEQGKELLQAKVGIEMGRNPDGSSVEKIEASTVIKVGEDLHVAWTWSGIKHTLFLNGKVMTTYLATTPFPRVIEPTLFLLHSLHAKDQAAAPIFEIAAYDFAFTESEAARDFAEKDNRPFDARTVHGPSSVAEWAPGERKVHITVDAGNKWVGKALRAEISVQRGRQSIGREEFNVGLDGFGETLVSVQEMPAGKYHVDVVLRGGEGRELAKLQTDPWDLPNTPWLGNRLGITDKIQPPWQPIRRSGLTLKVWGRDYELAGGFGLPQQVMSQGRKLLAKPVGLELMRGAHSLPLRNPSVEITQHQPHAATWTGHVDADDLRVRIDGRLDYDGMMLLTLHLEPRVPGQTVKLDGLKVHTVLPRERALFLNTSTDQGYWWYSYKSWLPDEGGGPLSASMSTPMVRGENDTSARPTVLLDNTKQRPGKTSFLFFVLMCDHDVGLEWFADGLGGWQVDERRTLQEIIRETNGDVRLTCHLANRPFEVTAPITLTFGYDATPVKALPADWRSAYVHHHPLKDVPSDLTLWWIWDGSWRKFRPNIFSLQPDDPKGFAKSISRVPGVKLAPFTNQHVLVAAGSDRRRSEGGWPWLSQLLQGETDNDGWTAVPTRGARDYWAWNIDQWIKAGSMDAIYIDEAHTHTISARLLTGSGYVRPDGTHGFGHNTLAMREQMKRVRQLFLDNGKRPVVWIPTYGMIIPHAHAFVDVVSEGEAFMFEKPGKPDWIDSWANGLLERRGGPGVKGGPWLLALGPAQKFGFVPIFLNYIRFYKDPQYISAIRAQYGLLGLLDIIPVEPMVGWFFKAKHAFGVAAPETTFHRFFDQCAISTERADVPVSYYRRGHEFLLIITNLGKDAYAGPVKLDRKALGLPSGMLAAKSIDGQKTGEYRTALKIDPLRFDPDGTTLRVRIPSHDFLMIEIERAQSR